jgi:chorismate mutase/prephenate dehydratase
MKAESGDESGWRKLEEIRNRIDSIDDNILSLLFNRQAAAVEIGNLKKLLKLHTMDQNRESKVLEDLSSRGNQILEPKAIRKIYSQIIAAARAVQAPSTIAYLGPEATYSHQAALSLYGDGVTYRPMQNLDDVFESVENGLCSSGIVPLENSSEGTVRDTLNLFSRHDLTIQDEVLLRIQHHLLSHATDLTSVKCLYSHPMALAQCSRWIREHLPEVEVREVSSTAQAVSLIASDPSGAAIGSRTAGNIYSVPILKKKIENRADNITRFASLGRGVSCPAPTGNDRTSLLMKLEHRPGALYRALGALAKNEVNISRIDSYPSGTANWEYLFFLDLDGHKDDEHVSQALQSMAGQCNFLKMLGSYPKGEESWT